MYAAVLTLKPASIAQGGQPVDAHIDAHRLARVGDRLVGHCYLDAHKPPRGCFRDPCPQDLVTKPQGLSLSLPLPQPTVEHEPAGASSMGQVIGLVRGRVQADFVRADHE